MSLLLEHVASTLKLQISLSPALDMAVGAQWSRCTFGVVRSAFVRDLQAHIESALWKCIDWDIKPPTDAQIAYATVLAARHQVEIPPDALLFRLQMALFLESLVKKPGSGEPP